MTPAIDVLRRLARSPRVRPDWRINNKDFKIVVGDGPSAKFSFWVVNEPDDVSLTNWRKRSFPNSKNPRVANKPKLRPIKPQPPVLSLYGQRHRDQSPHGLLRGVARADGGTATDPSAGMAPVPSV